MKKFSLISLSIAFVFLCLSSLFFSCKEDYDDLEYYPYSLNGYVTDYHTGKPLANVSFNISCGEYSQGMQLHTKRYYYEGVAKTDSKGYYKIRIPKGNKDMDFSVVFPHPQDISGYNFEGGKFDCKQFATTSIRADITTISYGYLKVIMPKNAIWTLGGVGDNYSYPRFDDKFLYSRAINDSMKYDFFQVAAHEGWGDCYANGHFKVYDFIVEKPRDTVVINIEE